MKRFAVIAAFAASSLVLPGYVMAQSDQAGGQSGGSQASAPGQKASSKSETAEGKSGASADAAFVRKAAEGGLAEVELGRLATQNAGSDDVKKFGQRMVDDHTKANQQLASVASSENITIPSDLSAADKQLKGRLEKLSGAAFDKEYMAHMVSDHTKDVSQFSREAKTGKDPDVKSFASSTLPVLQEHLTMAQSVDQTVKGSASGESEKGSKKGAKKDSGK